MLSPGTLLTQLTLLTDIIFMETKFRKYVSFFYTVARYEGSNIDICTDLDRFCNDIGDVGGRMLRLLCKSFA